MLHCVESFRNFALHPEQESDQEIWLLLLAFCEETWVMEQQSRLSQMVKTPTSGKKFRLVSFLQENPRMTTDSR
jgi:hypothetical protein